MGNYSFLGIVQDLACFQVRSFKQGTSGFYSAPEVTVPVSRENQRQHQETLCLYLICHFSSTAPFIMHFLAWLCSPSCMTNYCSHLSPWQHSNGTEVTASEHRTCVSLLFILLSPCQTQVNAKLPSC